jgi:hypothetical protein
MKQLTFILILFINLTCSVYCGNSTAVPLSTEIQIGRIKTLIDRAPKGTFLTVGGERAFREASMFEGIDYLVIFDISPEIMKFIAINKELLKAPDKEKYKHLRWEATLQEWKEVSNVLSKDDFKWWNDNVRNSKRYNLSEKLNRYGQENTFLKIRNKLMSIFPQVSKKFDNYDQVYLNHVTWQDIEKFQNESKDPLTKQEFDWFDQERKSQCSYVYQFIQNPNLALNWGQIIDYRAGNYLFHDGLYQRLHRLTKENKILFIQIDLTKQEDVARLIETIKKLESTLAVVDLNNLYLYEYMGEDKFRKALSQLLDLGTKESILILMNNYLNHPFAQFSIYMGFTFEHVRTWQTDAFLTVFLRSLPYYIFPLLDGRLYVVNDELPFNFMKP